MPAVLSFEGYGVAENAVFPLSAWTGLFVTTRISLRCWSSEVQIDSESSVVESGSSPTVFELSSVDVLFSGTSECLQRLTWRPCQAFIQRCRTAVMVVSALVTPVVVALNAFATAHLTLMVISMMVLVLVVFSQLLLVVRVLLELGVHTGGDHSISLTEMLACNEQTDSLYAWMQRQVSTL
eukprot:TRINITY_DN46018_c0_g1_i1.p1 TRINITY_DN46018_c0_g1~~TRINITY_DN46018_c0_g1_i1.p1  ORF type:complete len:191 (+),score=16.73 TRINITY_DN46018_c0_g1_i1:32-574(+)